MAEDNMNLISVARTFVFVIIVLHIISFCKNQTPPTAYFYLLIYLNIFFFVKTSLPKLILHLYPTYYILEGWGSCFPIL